MVDDRHFDKVFWFICGIGGAVLLFDCAVIFVPVPPGGQKYADTLVGALNTGILMAAVQYLLGGSPQTKKQPDNSVTTNTDTGNVVVNAPPVQG